ncbi:MAG: 3-isopropylmalate dehydratase large subunit [Anaerolineales bacterium]|nr:3-isopropylmalate dehydratase large subunit [Anaerolineales bacterium]
MGKTFAEKALARAAGLSETVAGQVVDARPDLVLSHDNTAAIYRIFKSIGVADLAIPEKLAITLDHAVPAPTAQHARNHAEVREFVARYGVRHFFEAGRGICHQVLSEEALVLPGQLILGADSHTPHFGWLGAFGAGVGRTEVAVLWATGELWLRVPETIKFTLTGTLGKGITTKDLCLHLIGKFGADGGLYLSVEFDGPALATFSLESRMVIPNMMAEFGAKNAYLPPDESVFQYLAERRVRRAYSALRSIDLQSEIQNQKSEIQANAIYPDADANYVATHVIDCSTIELTVSCPHTVDNTQPLSAVRGTRIHQAFIGTCTNGRLEDLALAAEVIRGKRVAAGARLLIVPASAEVYREAVRRGYVQTLLEAGAMFGTPGCGPCMGNHMGVLAPGEVCISSANRNFKGRMGQPEAEIYLASPAVVAASAVTGVITDPRELD